MELDTLSVRVDVPSYEGRFADRLAFAVKAAKDLDIRTLLDFDVDVIVEQVAQAVAAAPVRPQFDSLWINRYLSTVDLDGDATTVLIVELIVPCFGAAALLIGGGSPANRGGTTAYSPYAEPGRPIYEVSYQVQLGDSPTIAADLEGQLASARDRWVQALKSHVGTVNASIAAHRKDVEGAVRPIVASRQRMLRAIDSAAAVANIPLSPNRDSVVSIPLTPRQLTFARAESSADAGRSTFALARDIADSIVEMISNFSRALERLPGTVAVRGRRRGDASRRSRSCSCELERGGYRRDVHRPWEDGHLLKVEGSRRLHRRMQILDRLQGSAGSA